MKKLLSLSLLVLTASVPALSQSAFDGTWKFNTSGSQPSSKPDVYLLQNGTYSCKTCLFPCELKADGKAHPVPPLPPKRANHPPVVETWERLPVFPHHIARADFRY